MLDQFLKTIGLSDKQIDIYLCVARYGQATVATVCDQLGRERTSSYKLMTSMVKQGWLVSSHKSNTTYYIAVDIATLRRAWDQQLQAMLHIDTHYDLIQQERNHLTQTHIAKTQVQIYDGIGGLSTAYQDIVAIVQQHHYIHIKYFASRTFEALANTDQQIHTIHEHYLQQLYDQQVQIQGYLGEGMSMMEQLISTTIQDPSMLANSNDAVTMRIIGHHVYIIIFKATPQIIHIHSYEYAQLMHFVGEQLSKINTSDQ